MNTRFIVDELDVTFYGKVPYNMKVGEVFHLEKCYHSRVDSGLDYRVVSQKTYIRSNAETYQIVHIEKVTSEYEITRT